MKNNYKKILSGGDRRSIGRSNRVVKLIDNQKDFNELFSLISDKDQLVAMRAADAGEKITINYPGLLVSLKK